MIHQNCFKTYKLWQNSRILHLQVNTFFKYWINTYEYYHNTNEYCHNTCEYWVGGYWIHHWWLPNPHFFGTAPWEIANAWMSYSKLENSKCFCTQISSIQLELNILFFREISNSIKPEMYEICILGQDLINSPSSNLNLNSNPCW